MEQIRVYKLPVSDLSNKNFELNIIDDIAEDNGQEISSFMRNRNTESAWLTTGSTDAADTTIEAIIADTSNVTDIFIIGHNFKNFDVTWWDGVAWVTLESITNNSDDFYHLDISGIVMQKIRIVIYNTIVANADKQVRRLIITEKLESGQFSSWPLIKKATQGLVKKDSVMLSGKHFISEAVGAYSVRLEWQGVTTQADVDIIESMFLGRRSFLIWLSGGSEEQFRFRITGYRRDDFYTVKPSNNYVAEYYKGYYTAMLKQGIDLVEVVD